MLKNLSKDQKTMLVVLTLINCLNYVDRQLIFPLFGHIKEEFQISDFKLGLLATWFLLIHSLVTIPLGIWADRVSRRFVIGLSVLVWSLASFASGLAQSFKQLLHIRAVVGIGEAGYAPAATAMISDSFPNSLRGRAQSFFNVGMFVGGTLGTFAGAIIVTYFADWRWAFFIVSPIGLLLAFAAFRLKEVKIVHDEPKIHPMTVLRNPAFLWILFSGTLITFAGGAYMSWGIEFFRRSKEFGLSLQAASATLGLIVALAGVVGVYLGGYYADKMHGKRPDGRSLVLTGFLFFSAPLIFLSLFVLQYKVIFFILFFLGIMCFCAYHGPITAIIHDITPKQYRASAYAVYVFVIHLLGDTLSPAIIGRASDEWGLRLALQGATVILFLGAISFYPVARLIKTGKVPVHLD
ncbi:MAG TPA: MFS transporter [Patescibacteria group bacterium]|nr:MFS transporter [Patescibacteria group bacterium]